MLILLLSLILAAGAPGTVTLAWDPNSETDLAGYKVYYGTASGTYGAPVTVAGTPTAPTYTVTGLAPGKYYFAVTAYNTIGLESGYSNEVSTTILAPPTGLTITSQSASLRWFGVVLLATTNEKASAILRYRQLVEGAKSSTVIATPTPAKTEHRAILYDLPASAHYSYEWEMTSASGVVVKGLGTFETR